MSYGDKIRHWSRLRVQQHFIPHYLDSPQVFAAPKSMGQWGKVDWQRDKLDYILLSALSSSPNQTYYPPSRAGIPNEDQREIKKWLDWGRANIAYLMVRRDLPDWPARDQVDGSAHLVGDTGLVFLFNPNKIARPGEFALRAESIGLNARGAFRIAQEYPQGAQGGMASGRPTPALDGQRPSLLARHGETVKWEVPAESAVVLRIKKSTQP